MDCRDTTGIDGPNRVQEPLHRLEAPVREAVHEKKVRVAVNERDGLGIYLLTGVEERDPVLPRHESHLVDISVRSPDNLADIREKLLFLITENMSID